MSTVKILREVKLPDPFYQVRLRSLDRLRFVPVPHPTDDYEATSTAAAQGDSCTSAEALSAKRKRFVLIFIF